MPKASTAYVCQNCGTSFMRWMGRCEQCGAWNSLVEQSAPAALSQAASAHPLAPSKIADVKTAAHPRLRTGQSEVDQVLGGGIVPGAVMLLSGDPGIGKSTLVLQIAAYLAASHPVLYVSGEESAVQIKMRAERLKLDAPGLELATDTEIDRVAATIARSPYKLVIIDSIQTMQTAALAGAAGTVGQISACCQILQAAAKQANIPVLIIGHVTKEGAIAGPKILEHLVDVVLYLEGERYGAFKALRASKTVLAQPAKSASLRCRIMDW